MTSPHDNGTPDQRAHLAQLVGWDDPTAESSTNDAFPNDNGESTALLDPEDLQEEEVTPKRPLWENPFAKAGLVFSGTGVVALGIILTVNAFNNVTSRPEAPGVEEPTEEEVVESAEVEDEEVGRLKTIAALGNQADEIQAAAAADPLEEGPEAIETQPQEDETPPARASAPEQTRPPATRPARAPQPVAPPERYGANRQAETAALPPEPVDPREAWHTATSVGSYGTISPVISEAAETEQAEPTASPVADSEPTSGEIVNTLHANNASVQSDFRAILNGEERLQHEVVAGQEIEGILSTPIMWSAELEANAQPQQYAIQLTEPLLDAQQQPLLPEGTLLVVTQQGITDSGFVDLYVVGAIPPNATIDDMIPLPGDAFLIADDDGEPLLAEELSNSGDAIAALDRQLALFGGLQGFGEFVTSAEESITVSSNFQSQSSERRPDLNPLTAFGSIARGAFEPLQEQVLERNRERMSELVGRSRVWYIEPGEELEIFVLSNFSVMQ
ncbi:MAG: hypothetical protein AAFY26_00855 [Cyanobacteria bacterium J06638_22]